LKELFKIDSFINVSESPGRLSPVLLYGWLSDETRLYYEQLFCGRGKNTYPDLQQVVNHGHGSLLIALLSVTGGKAGNLAYHFGSKR